VLLGSGQSHRSALGVDAVRLQRVVSSMKRFGLLPRSTRFQVTSMIAG
jgi:hypothetical protein